MSEAPRRAHPGSEQQAFGELFQAALALGVPDIDRRPFSMSVMRPDGTLRSSPSRFFALGSRAFNSRLNPPANWHSVSSGSPISTTERSNGYESALMRQIMKTVLLLQLARRRYGP